MTLHLQCKYITVVVGMAQKEEIKPGEKRDKEKEKQKGYLVGCE
jgi:hypothetical protein